VFSHLQLICNQVQVEEERRLRSLNPEDLAAGSALITRRGLTASGEVWTPSS